MYSLIPSIAKTSVPFTGQAVIPTMNVVMPHVDNAIIQVF